MRMEVLLEALGHPDRRFGVLAESDTDQLTVIARNTDVAVGDLFLLPCRRGPDRFYLFRTTHYANILAYQDMNLRDVAGNKVRFTDSYFAEDANIERLIELRGMVLGYAEYDARQEAWGFHRPRRLPEHLSDVYRVDHQRPEVAEVLCTLMRRQLGEQGLYLGDLLAGEESLTGVPVYLPPYALSHHIGVFGRTGTGKSNLMMVLLRSAMEYNRAVQRGEASGPKASVFAIDPHDEFRYWHRASGGADGIHGIVHGYTENEQRELIAPFYYLTAKNLNRGDDPLARRVFLSRADIVPDDLISISEFSEAQIAFASQFYGEHGERWVSRLFLTGPALEGKNNEKSRTQSELGAEFLPGTIAAVQRRIDFLRFGHTRLVNRFSEGMYPYDSTLPDILCALEQGRVLIVDTTLMNEMEQFLLTTVVARVLFSLRKALRSADSPESLPHELRLALMNDDEQGQLGMRSLADELVRRLKTGELPYLQKGSVIPPDLLPYINIVVEEAPSVLNPQRMKFGSVFRDISRQGRKFGIGLTVVSQQVTEIDQGVLTQINTELTMSLGNENERREAIRTASADLRGFERELQVMGKGQVLLSASYRDIPLPVHIPNYDG